MKIKSKFKNDDGRLLVIFETPKGHLVGEVYSNGEYKRGKWDSRATFSYWDYNDEYRVKEYFGFNSSNSICLTK